MRKFLVVVGVCVLGTLGLFVTKVQAGYWTGHHFCAPKVAGVCSGTCSQNPIVCETSCECDCGTQTCEWHEGCAPDCGTRECGPVPNGCGTDCGTCPSDNTCRTSDYHCVSNSVPTDTPVNGVCAATHYNCSAGALGYTADYSDRFEWWCNGTNGGTNILCDELKPDCATDFSVSCAGSTATISWTAPGNTSVSYYNVRLNHEPYDPPDHWYNAAEGDQFLTTSTTSTSPTVDLGANYNYDIQGVTSDGLQGARCPFLEFNCPIPTATPVPPTPTPTDTPIPMISISIPTRTPTPVPPTPTPIPPPVMSCSATPSGINWSWNMWAGITDYWLQVWGELPWPANGWGYTSPTFTTGTPGVTYSGRVAAGDGTQTSPWSNTASCTVPLPSMPTGACGNFNNNPTNPATPVTWTWANGTGIQVKDDTGKWWYNAAASSGITISKDENNLGPTFAVPPGRIVYGRTTYDFINGPFSAWGLISPSPTCPLPANPSPVTVSGPLQQKSGTTGCHQADATNYFTIQNPTTTTDPSSCVATNCTVATSNSEAETYSCTTTFSSNDCLNDDPPTWPTSATITLTGIAPPGYTLIGWTPNGSCDSPVNTKTVNAGDTIANQPLTFDFSGNNWMKLKNSSFNGVSVTSITVPNFVTNYGDADDDGSKYFIIAPGSVAGLVLNTTVFPNSDPLNLHYSYPNNWYDSSYAVSFSMHPSDFLSYVKSRKEYKTISDLSSTSIDKDGIYVWKTGIPFPEITAVPATFNNWKVVLIVPGAVSINMPNFTPSKSVAIIANSITFSDTTETANGIFIANTIDVGTTTNLGLKINGNLVAQTTFTNHRQWSDTSRPAVFIVFKPNIYIDLLPYLSIANYEWKQIQ